LTVECQKAFENLKEKLISTLVLRGPNWHLLFQIHTDALERDLCIVLGQNGFAEKNAICYISENIFFSKLNYIVIEKEFLAMIYTVNKF
jgi:hypothetical protein